MKAIILAGGKGRRLAPYTAVLPKPLMPIGDIPILEVVVRQLKHAGVTQITMAVGYLAELMMAYFGDGERFGLEIRYSREEEPLGTAGPIGLIRDLDEPFFVMNGDLLTTLDYQAMWETHAGSGAIGTLATFQRCVNIDLGVIETDRQGLVIGYVEKPVYHYTVSTGIYIFDPLVLDYIPYQQRIDLPQLVLNLLAEGRTVSTFAFDGYWLDIGRHDDYQQAVAVFEENRERFLPLGDAR